MQKNKIFTILIIFLAGLILIQAVSISILMVKNAKLKQALIRKGARKTVLPKKVVPVPSTQAPIGQEAGIVAIVLDDWGYNKKNLDDLFSLDQPVTISILPNLPFSKFIAQEAEKRNKEVILHLPLEAHDSSKRPEKDAIYTNMNKKEILTRLQSAFDSVPYIKGVNNHMGSKATEDEVLMKFLFLQFKKKNLYFLDSLVTNKSICLNLASEVGIKFAERSVFLDNNNDIEYIKGQLRQLLSIAEQKKSAVGIGHDRPLTIKAIKQMLPDFQRKGIRLVYLSELVK